VVKPCYNTYMNLNNVDEEWFRRDRSFRIIGNDQVGYHVRACGNHRVLSDREEPLKTLQDARNWLTEYYPGVIIHTSQQGAVNELHCFQTQQGIRSTQRT
jgi:hypothetical protein